MPAAPGPHPEHMDEKHPSTHPEAPPPRGADEGSTLQTPLAGASSHLPEAPPHWCAWTEGGQQSPESSPHRTAGLMGLFWGRSWGDPAPTPHCRVPWKLSCRPLCRKGRVQRCGAGAAPLSVSRRSMGAGLLGETLPVALAPWGPRRRRDGGSRGEQQSGGHPPQDRQAEPSSLTLPSTGGLQGLLGGRLQPHPCPSPSRVQSDVTRTGQPSASRNVLWPHCSEAGAGLCLAEHEASGLWPAQSCPRQPGPQPAGASRQETLPAPEHSLPGLVADPDEGASKGCGPESVPATEPALPHWTRPGAA